MIGRLTHGAIAARNKLKRKRMAVLGDGNPKIDSHNKPVLFLHTKGSLGTLVGWEGVPG